MMSFRPGRFAVQHILKRDAVEIPVDHGLQPLPHGEREAVFAAGAFVGRLIEARHRGERALRDAQDLSDGVVRRVAQEAALIPVNAVVVALAANGSFDALSDRGKKSAPSHGEYADEGADEHERRA